MRFSHNVSGVESAPVFKSGFVVRTTGFYFYLYSVLINGDKFYRIIIKSKSSSRRTRLPFQEKFHGGAASSSSSPGHRGTSSEVITLSAAMFEQISIQDYRQGIAAQAKCTVSATGRTMASESTSVAVV